MKSAISRSLPERLSSRWARAINYTDATGPRYAANHAPSEPPSRASDSLAVVTLNIQFARRIDRALRLFGAREELARADIVLLQEMDARGTDAIAAHLRMNYVYYPATVHPQTNRDFGNAVLSRWPIVADEKIGLPHLSLLDGSARAATRASVRTPVETVDVCSLHLSTPVELWPAARRAQIREVLSRHRRSNHVVLGGDFNSRALGALVASEAFDWATRDVGKTARYWSVDHLFARGLRTAAAGKVLDTLGATDHAAVWTELGWR